MQQGWYETYRNAFMTMLIQRMCILLYLLQKQYTNVRIVFLAVIFTLMHIPLAYLKNFASIWWSKL